MERHLRHLSIIGTVGMILVLLMGATVTDTGSGEGCGRSWPLCHGEFLPISVRESVIEFSHRVITGVLGIVILLLAIGAIRARHRNPGLLPLVPIMVARCSCNPAWAPGRSSTHSRTRCWPCISVSHWSRSLVSSS